MIFLRPSLVSLSQNIFDVTFHFFTLILHYLIDEAEGEQIFETQCTSTLFVETAIILSIDQRNMES